MDTNQADHALIGLVLRQIHAHLRKRNLLLAFSGGLDSTVLFHLLVQLRDAGEIAPFTAMHVNHGLQPQAVQWVRHVQATADAFRVPLVVHPIELDLRPGGRGIESAARAARYEALASRMEEGGALITAHQLDDQAETFLLQLMRGAGVRGLSAMPVHMPFARGWHLRPLLGIRRAELEAYAQRHALRWVEDPSNSDTRFARNHVRHELLPVLRRHWPQAEETLARAARRMATTEGLLHDLARLDLERAQSGEPATLNVQPMLQLSPERLQNALRFWLLELDLPLPPEPRLAEIARLLRVRPDAVPEVQWDETVVRRWREGLYAMRDRPRPPRSMDVHWTGDAPLDLPELGLRLVPHRTCGQGLALGLAGTFGLNIRLRTGGERIQLPGRIQHKDVKQLLQEAGIPPWERARMPFIHVGERLVQVGDRWISSDALARDQEEGLVIHLRELV